MVFQELSYSPDCVSIVWEDGRISDFDAMWLRNNDPERATEAAGAEIARAVPAGSSLRVFWTDGAVASFSMAWLYAEACRAGMSAVT